MPPHRPEHSRPSVEIAATPVQFAAAPVEPVDDRLPALEIDRAPLFEIRPDAATFWRGVRSRALIFLPLIAVTVYRATGQGMGSSLFAFCGLVLALVFAALTMLQTSSLVLTATTVEKHRRWLPPKTVQRSAVASGVLVPQYQSTFNRTAPLLILAGRNGRPLLRLTGQIYSGADLHTLAQRVGYGYFDLFDSVAGPKAVARRHPKLIPLFERRPMVVTVFGTVVLLVAVVVGISILDPAV